MAISSTWLGGCEVGGSVCVCVCLCVCVCVCVIVCVCNTLCMWREIMLKGDECLTRKPENMVLTF